ncbi:MAG: sigma-70 family RNA polymerase sigma factor [Oscillospiraceae bacterium]|nr:sigma-70 family RNA polymerase sigma factor [Oscillospiraceae bacterium]
MQDKNTMVEENLGLVHLCANKFRGRSIEYEELYSAGCVGLVKAVNAFDEKLGYKFSTYAVPVILGEIKRLFRDGGTVKVSRSLKELSLRITKIREGYIKDNGREPHIEELCELSGETKERVVEALNVAMPPLSLTSQSDDNDNANNELDIPVDSPDEKIVMSLALRQALSKLEAKDRELIRLRFVKNKTQMQTASVLNMTQVQVSRREKKLLLTLRELLL